MANHHGRNADVKYNSTVMGNIESWSLDISGEVAKKRAFGEDSYTKYNNGYDWAGSITGWTDLSDAGQLAFYNACISGTTITGATFYEDTVGHFSGDILTTGFSVEATREDWVKTTFTFEGSGDLLYT